MNLEDVIDPEYGLQQDEWSLTKPRFGKDGQIEVVGWSGKRKNSKAKFIVVKCNFCINDPEIYGEGYFKTRRDALLNGRIPCGCSIRHEYSAEQNKILCERKAEESGYKFIGFKGEFKKRSNTYVVLECQEHGIWDTSSIDSLLRRGSKCPICSCRKPDSEMIASFFASGAFHPDTKFWRSDRQEKSNGSKISWYYHCPECNTVAEARSGEIQKGTKSCMCAKHRQKETYINLIKHDDNVVAIKFGVANNAIHRVSKQNYESCYDVENYGIWKFSSKPDCYRAENECSINLVCGVISKEEFPDGWTETTYPYNIEKIVQIYEQYGGVRIQ